MTPEQNPEPNKRPIYMGITGINLMVMIGYTLMCGLAGEEGLLVQIFLVIIHAIVCVIVAPFARKWEWVLAGLLVLIIGVSSCFGLLELQGGLHLNH
ncbi:hypothetical protein LT679_02375 [Mucilaginibacter roseus]|uniref:Uncharacterized protein n=1 Tax=Mucilaginibacter roseus TaxID=1528868 RepID=A0ABS8TX25_9SPHI|nr:hypothetical protein [Mucilaginibacter roseus]MCD8739436.1 hypothetical protein [Mucilaginibacter roseus]